MKISWQGTIEGVQPRIRLMRFYDERSHTYLGYVLLLNGIVEGVSQDFTVAIGNLGLVCCCDGCWFGNHCQYRGGTTKIEG